MASDTDVVIKGIIFTLEDIDKVFRDKGLGVPSFDDLKAFILGAKVMHERMLEDGYHHIGRTERGGEDNAGTETSGCDGTRILQTPDHIRDALGDGKEPDDEGGSC